MNNGTKNFPAKILLFGEYTLLKGSKGLAMPFDRFCASFKKLENAHSVDRAFRLNDFCTYLKSSKILSENMDLDRLTSDIEQGIYLNSNIPVGYGIGSSGALCAAIYAHYSDSFERKDTYTQDQIKQYKDMMSLMENFYHGTSSGLDCLISLINKAIMVSGRSQYDSIETPDLQSVGNFYLYDSAITRKTASFVYGFLQEYEDNEGYKTNIDEHGTLVNQLIENVIGKDKDSFKANIVELSHFQYLHFADMIPDSVKALWMNGLKTKEYYFKLCGAGGGGYFLVYSDHNDLALTQDYIQIA